MTRGDAQINVGLTISIVISVTRMMPIRLSQMPARHICGMVIRPELKTMALGGVATGIMNAQLAARAAGKISR